MRKAVWIVVSLFLLFLLLKGAFFLWWLHPENVSFYNRKEWTLFGNGSEWFWSFMQFVIIAVTITLIYGELRLSAATHLLGSLTSLNERWTSHDMVSQRQKICHAYLKREQILTLGTQNVFTFFEELGLYAKRGWVPPRVIWDTYSYHIECYWDMCSQEVVDRRSKLNDPSVFENFDQLAKDMRVINKKRGISFSKRTAEQLKEFAEGEGGCSSGEEHNMRNIG
jgi:hypothetical protein